MDGDVWAESEVNKGSTFHFTGWLGKAEDREANRYTAISFSGKKVLIVDDNQTNLDMLTGTLELVGIRVVALRKPEEVIPTLKKALEAEDPFDLCISDIQMPGMSGYEVAREIRNWEGGTGNLPLLALSSSMGRDARRCKEAGFDGFLTKPTPGEKLFQMIERILGERAEEGEKEAVVTEKIMTQYSVREDMKHSVSILLAEDNPVSQKLAKTILTKAGYKVEVADDGKEAVEKYTSSPDGFDLIFMDVQMPEMDGLEATAKIREKELELETRNPQPESRIPIIAMTAAAMKGDREKCLDAGMDDYIPKPIKRQLVFEIIEKWVFKKRAL
jgi:CheY-like chemotaxis protein